MEPSDDDVEFQSAGEEEGLAPDDSSAHSQSATSSDDGNEDDDDYQEDEDDEEDEDSADDDDRRAVFLNVVTHSPNVYATILNNLPKLATYTPPVLVHDLADELALRTAATAPGTPEPLLARQSQHRRGAQRVVNASHLQMLREGGLASHSGHSSDPASMHFAAFHRLPTRPVAVADRMESRGYIGQFTKDGEVFVAAFQNQRKIRMYDVHRGWRVCKDVHARNLRWTVTDVALSSDQRFLLYASITPTVHLVNVEHGGSDHSTESIANVTDIHEALHLGNGAHNNGIWSLQWSGDNTEIIAGTADSSLYIYDVAAGRTVVKAHGHNDDVNAVAYADASSQMIFTGSDDNFVKVWDRRLLSESRSRTPVGVFVGHTEGVTHLDSKGDGRYVISNSKDQTIKLWDVRAMRSPREAAEASRAGAIYFQWDYRWMSYPAADRVVAHPNDGALATYRGHKVLSTLIRCYWSPAHTTGQRYIYTGSADGGVRIYDVVTAKEVSRLQYHREVVRDCSWHPFLPMLATVSFDGSVCTFEPEVPGEREAAAEEEAVRVAGAEDRGKGKKARRGGLPMPGVDQYNW